MILLLRLLNDRGLKLSGLDVWCSPLSQLYHWVTFSKSLNLFELRLLHLLSQWLAGPNTQWH